MLQGGIEIQPTLLQSRILPLLYRHLTKQRYFLVYNDIRLSATGVLNSREELCIYAYVSAGNSSLKRSSHGGGGSIFTAIQRQTFYCFTTLHCGSTH